MTKEEAIHFAKCLKHNYTINFADMEVFCDMVIKALEQEPCEDAISRKALIERINKAEDDFKTDNMEIIASGGDSFVDGVLSGIFNVREMVIQAQSICKAESEVD